MKASHVSQKVADKDFTTKTKTSTRNKKGKREYLSDIKTKDFMDKLNDYFELMVEIPRIKVGHRQSLDTLISEEALLLARYIRGDSPQWHPRIS